jgi:hypothetical protein
MQAAPKSQPVLERRFEKTGRMEDLERAIRKAQQAVEVTPQDHPDLADRLSNHTVGYISKKCHVPNFENQGASQMIIVIHHNQSTYLTRPFYPFYNGAGNSKRWRLIARNIHAYERHACEKHAYKRHTYERHAMRCTPMRGTP